MNLNNVKSGSLRWLRAEELPLPVDSWPLEMVFLGVNESSNIKYFAIDVHGPATSSPADLPAIAATGVSGAGSPSALHGTDLQSGAGRLRGAAIPPALATRQDQSLATPFAAASAVSAGRGYAPEKINGTETMTEALTMHVRRGTRAPPENPSLLDDTLGELERFVDVRLSLAFITDPAEVTAVSMARSLMYFHQSHGFCARCGARTGQWEPPPLIFSPLCHDHLFSLSLSLSLHTRSVTTRRVKAEVPSLRGLSLPSHRSRRYRSGVAGEGPDSPRPERRPPPRVLLLSLRIHGYPVLLFLFIFHPL